MVREFLTVAQFSKEHQTALQGEHLLRPWGIFASLGSVGVDFGDSQWRNFCANFAMLAPFMLALVGISRFIRSHERSKSTDQSFRHSRLALFHCAMGLGYALYLHGPRITFMLALVLANYFIIAPLCKVLSFRTWLACVWVFHIGILLINDRYSGYSFAALFGAPSAVDTFGEIMPWNVVFNMSTLRMIAYCIDYEEALHRGSGEMKARLEDKHKTGCTDCVGRRSACYKLRTDTPRPLPEYTLVHYLAYLFYVPLYVAGPMSSFNAFVSHIYTPQRWFGLKDGVRYFCRIIGLALTLMVLLHFAHLHAITAHPSLFGDASISVKVSFFIQSLAFLWLKFSVFWKFFRLISLADGFDVPEDMVRCFASVTTIANFWRDWHASFNIWIIRYMYIPMGGSRFKILAIFPIFGFIALWHDIEMKLFWWAGVMCIAFLPEAIGTAFFSQPRFSWIQGLRFYPQLRVAASYVSIMSLILGNLVGYGAASKDTGSGASKAFGEVLTNIDVVCAMSLPITSSYITWYLVDREREAANRLRWELGMPAPASGGKRAKASANE